jgi:hypothetical protein
MESIFAGLGEDEDELQRIFDDYQQTEPRETLGPSLESSASRRREVIIASSQPVKFHQLEGNLSGGSNRGDKLHSKEGHLLKFQMNPSFCHLAFFQHQTVIL